MRKSIKSIIVILIIYVLIYEVFAFPFGFVYGFVKPLFAQETTKSLEPIPTVKPTPEQKKTLEQRRLEQISTFDPQAEARLQYKAQGLEQIAVVEGLGQPNYLIKEFNDFSGGLNLSAFKTQLKPNEALELENALINPEGKLYKRRGFSECTSSPEEAPYNFHWRFYTEDGDEYLMAGSDTAMYYAIGDNCDFTYLIGTGGVSGRWDGTTFNDKFVGTHIGIKPIVWDGTNLAYLGEASYLYDSSWANSCTLWVHVKDVVWDDDELVGMYALQDSPSYQDGGIPFGQIIDNTIEAFAIKYNAESGSNLWTPDQNVTLISALSDSIWVGGIIDTIYSGEDQSEILYPKDTIRSEWNVFPAVLDSHYKAIDEYPDSMSYGNWILWDYIYSDDTTKSDGFTFTDHSLSLTDVDDVTLHFFARTVSQMGENLLSKFCLGDTTRCYTDIFYIDPGIDYNIIPHEERLWHCYRTFQKTPDGDDWTADKVDSIIVLFTVPSSVYGMPDDAGFINIEIHSLWIDVDYDATYEMTCGTAIFDSSLFDTLFQDPLTIPTYFEWIPQDYPDTGIAGREYRAILTTNSGIYDTHYYLLFANPEIPDLAVGDSFNLRHLYFTKSKFVENFDSRLWLAWTGTGAELNKNKVIWSEVHSLSNWPPENKWYIDKGGGDYITGMAQFFTDQSGYKSLPLHELVFFRNNDIFKGVPSSADVEYSFYRVASGIGCVSNLAIASAEGRFMIFPDQSGVYAYDGNKVQNISLKIKPIFEAWDLANLEWVSAIYNPEDRHYYISYPEKFPSSIPYCVVSWDDDRSVTDWDVYAQFLDYNFDKIDTNFMVNDTGAVADSNQSASDVAIDPQQNWVFVWDDERTGTGTGSIRIRRFDVDGDAIDTSYLVSDNGTYDRGMPHIDISSEGKIVVVWEDRRNAQYVSDIYGQRYDSSLTKIGSNFLIDTVSVACSEPHVQIGDNGNFVVSWLTNTDPKDNIYFQRYDSAANAINNNVAICDSAGASLDVGTYCDLGMEKDDGDFVLTWSQTTNFPTDLFKIWAELRDSAGTAKGSDFIVSSPTNPTKERPSVSMKTDGSFVVCWDDYRGSYAIPICRRFDSGGNALGNEIWVIPDTSEYPVIKYTQVDMDNSGVFAVAWTDFYNPADSTNTFVRAFSWGEVAQCSVTQTTDRRVTDQITDECAVAINRYFEVTANSATLAWSIDNGGWGRQSFDASAYGYQHGISDTVKIVFADPLGYVYWYGTQADDVDDPVIMTYQSKYDDFNTRPHYDKELRFATIEATLDTGTIYTYWYKNFGTLIYQDSVVAGGDCLKEFYLPDSLQGKNISLKIVTGDETDDFLLSRFWEEYIVDDNRK